MSLRINGHKVADVQLAATPCRGCQEGAWTAGLQLQLTVTFSGPWGSGPSLRVVHCSALALSTMILPQVTFPNDMLYCSAAAVNPKPRIVTFVPASVEPLLGVRLCMTGVSDWSKVKVMPLGLVSGAPDEAAMVRA